ncbi:MAG: ribosome-associated translation inhibitor RaiA [bacterium]
MKLLVTGRHVEVTEAMKNYAREKLGRVMHERPHINEIHVIMDVEKYRHRVELSARGKSLELFCQEETPDMYASIDRALAKLDRQLLRYKERHLRKNQPVPIRDMETPLVEETVEGEEPSITHRFAMEIMYPQEAFLQMKSERHLFFVFLNAETEEINLLYRLGEEEIGHLVPRKIKGMDQEAKFQLQVVREDSIAPDAKLRARRKEDCYVAWAAPEEALASMLAAGEKYRFFMSTMAENASVVYQQVDGAYALIEPAK